MHTRKDFSKWVPDKVAWMYVAHDMNTTEKHKQDVIASFWNAYIFYEQKAESYKAEFGKFPKKFLKGLIHDFRKHFPKSGRIDGVNYFDDLIELLIEKHETRFDKLIKWCEKNYLWVGGIIGTAVLIVKIFLPK